jgi:hypothetical protein
VTVLEQAEFCLAGGRPEGSGPAAAVPRLGFCDREDQFPITIQGRNDSRPRWLASASTPALPVADQLGGTAPCGTSGSFIRLTDGCQPVSFRYVRTCRRIRSNQLWGSVTELSLAGREELASIPDAGGHLPAPRHGRPHHPGDGCPPVTGHQGGQPWRVLWAKCGHAL